MKCPRCQHENPTGSNFCLGCGGRFGSSCSSCGNELPPGSRFCNKCGTPVALESPGQSRFSSPESYTPLHLAQKILTSKAALEGERKHVTVLFADLKGSTELLADRDPEEARKILDAVLERMMEAVHRFEGTVNQVMGDGIMALFGAPVAHGMVVVGDGRAEESHDAVAHDLVHRALEAVDGLHHALEHGVEDLARFLGITVGEELHGAFEVGEQNRHLLALAFESCLRGQDLLGEVLRGIGLGG